MSKNHKCFIDFSNILFLSFKESLNKAQIKEFFLINF